MIRHKIGFERSNAFPETAIWALMFGRKPDLKELSEQRDSFLFISIAPGITKNASSSTAPEAVSQLINGCAAQVGRQVLMLEG